MSTSQIEQLAPHTAWSLLSTACVIRLAVVIDGRPEIFPVNHVIDRGTLVFRTGAGTKLGGLLLEAEVAVEADGIDGDGFVWSVVVKGPAHPIAADEIVDTTELQLSPWHGSAKPHFVRVLPAEVTGRRFPMTAPLAWHQPVPDVR